MNKFKKITRKRWEPKEDEIITTAIGNFPTNYTYAFEVAAHKLKGRTTLAVAKRWQSHLSKEGAIVAVGTNQGVRVINRKNAPIPRQAKTSDMRMEVVIASVEKMNPREKKELVKYILDL